ncbi:trypsin-2-like [Phlebotomus papatasi]|nr:trypsin-2-like [Phlebotomus papatasi]
MVSSKYFAILVLAFTYDNVWSSEVPPDTRIVGGRPVQRDGLRQQASIRFKSSDSTFGNGHVCGGNLISNNTVLTAAHCFVDDLGRQTSVSDIRVVGGNLLLTEQTPNTFISDVARLVIHPGYNRRTNADDIAILILKNIVPASHSSFRPITLRTVPIDRDAVCEIAGWGATMEDGAGSNSLLAANVSIIDFNFCNNTYLGILTNGMVCAGRMEGGVDSCQGDSGGPLVCNGLLTGITSFGTGCARPGYPGVYTAVHTYYRWIMANAASQSGINSLFLSICLLLGAINVGRML